MDIIQTIIMGIVQGLSEFLPISSSAHLVFSSNLYKLFKGIEPVQYSGEEVFLDIMLHLGTLIAVLIYFRREIMEIIRALYLGIKTKDYSQKDFKLGVYIILGTILTVIVALFIQDFAEKLVFRPEIVGLILFLTGVILLSSEYAGKRFKDKKEISFKTAVIIGIAQGIAALPGFSRSGLTIASGLFSGVKRSEAARYSFLLSIPIILGASMVYPLVKINYSEILHYNIPAIISGTIVSGVVGYICIKYFMKFVSKFSLNLFGYYCLTLGLVTAILFSIL